MNYLPRISLAERRARLVSGHHLDRSASGIVEAVRGVVALHSSDPLTPHLALRARVPGFQTSDLDRQLHDARSLWRLHAMRRTLFVVPSDGARVFRDGVARGIAMRERRKVEKWLGAEMDSATPEAIRAWLADVEARIAEVLADGSEMLTRELAAAIPELGTEITLGFGKWSGRSPLSSRLLFLMAMDGRIVRTRPAGSWRSSQYGWALSERWFGGRKAPDAGDEAAHEAADGSADGSRGETAGVSAEAARADLARLYLHAFGPATLTDLRWWTGWNAKHARAAVAAIGAMSVELESAGEGIMLEADLELILARRGAEPGSVGSTRSGDAPDPGFVGAPRSGDRPAPGDAPIAGTPSGPYISLLPALDPTPMGWKERDWFLGEHGGRLFDRNGNVGPTVWLDGRIVGGWAQRPDGEVVYALLEDIGSELDRRVREEAAALGEWMDGTVAIPRFRTPLERALAEGSARPGPIPLRMDPS